MLENIFKEGDRRYGKAEAGERETLRWNGGQTTVAAVSNDEGLHRVFIASNGPTIETCSTDHGHPISDHWMQLLGKP
jgi:hypothetical protein